LAHLVLEAIDFAKGSFRVALPRTLDESRPLDFRSQTFHLGGDEDLSLALLIKAFIRGPEHAVLLQDTQASISDRWLTDYKYKELVRTYRTELYWAVERPLCDLPDEEMASLISSTSFWPFSAFFYPRGARSIGKELLKSDLARIAETLIGLAVGAFDDRSFLFWWRDDQLAFPL
jgi:hypothetical protein